MGFERVMYFKTMDCHGNKLPRNDEEKRNLKKQGLIKKDFYIKKMRLMSLRWGLLRNVKQIIKKDGTSKMGVVCICPFLTGATQTDTAKQRSLKL